MIDPDTIHISRHALSRYCERRGWAADDHVEADRTIRKLLQRVAHKNPPIAVVNGHTPSRRYISGGMAWVTSADATTLITFYPVHHPKRRFRK